MKKAAVLLTLIFCVGALIGQSNITLKGPAAKNYKPWKDKKVQKQEVVMVMKETQPLKGPAAKNAKPWQQKKVLVTTTADIATNRRLNLKGPAAKNYKPWKQEKIERSMASVEK